MSETISNPNQPRRPHGNAASQGASMLRNGLVEKRKLVDGPGRVASKGLPRLARFSTLRTMRLPPASCRWHPGCCCSVRQHGEMNPLHQVSRREEQGASTLSIADRTAPGWNDLPENFRDLGGRSLRPNNRVALLDRGNLPSARKL